MMMKFPGLAAGLEEKRNAYKIQSEKSEGKIPHGRAGNR
jgi:hypothetical protein